MTSTHVQLLCACIYSILLGIYLELLNHIIALCLTFWGNAKLFSKVGVPFPPVMYENPNFLTSLPTLSFFFFFFLRFVFIYSWETQKERETHTQAEGEAGPTQEARCGTQSQDHALCSCSTAEPPRHPFKNVYSSFIYNCQKQPRWLLYVNIQTNWFPLFSHNGIPVKKGMNYQAIQRHR